MHRSPPEGLRLSRRRSVLGHLARPRTWTMVAALACTGVAMLPTGTRADLTPAADAAAPVGQGFTVTPSDLAFILKQIKIAERHSRALIPQLDPGNAIPDNPNPTTDPVYCQSMIGTGPDQIPSSLLSFGLRTVRGDCNNLIPGQSNYGAADTVFPRHATPVFKAGEAAPPGFPPASPGGYASKRGFVYDTEPRTISNLIVDQTVNNPAAVHAAGTRSARRVTRASSRASASASARSSPALPADRSRSPSTVRRPARSRPTRALRRCRRPSRRCRTSRPATSPSPARWPRTWSSSSPRRSATPRRSASRPLRSPASPW